MKKAVQTSLAIILLVTMSSCLQKYASPAAAASCEPQSILLRDGAGIISSQWTTGVSGQYVIKSAEEATDLGITIVPDAVDFDSEMLIIVNHGCYSGCGPIDMYISSVKMDCERVVLETGGDNLWDHQRTTCMAYFCTNSSAVVKKTDLPVHSAFNAEPRYQLDDWIMPE